MDQTHLLLSLIAYKSAVLLPVVVFVCLMFLWVIANSLADRTCTWRNNCPFPKNLIHPSIFSLSSPSSLSLSRSLLLFTLCLYFILQGTHLKTGW